MTTQDRIYRINELASILSMHSKTLPMDTLRNLQDAIDKLAKGLPDAVNDF